MFGRLRRRSASGLSRSRTVLQRLRYSPRRLRRLIDAGAFADREILAYREDGFGMRLGEILNAIRLAHGFGARFAFAWPTTTNDGIRPAEEVFEAAFLAAHLLEEVDESAYSVVTTWSVAGVRALHRGGGRGIWSVSKRSLSHKQKFVLGTDGVRLPPLMTMREAFDLVRFCAELEAVRAAVDAHGPFDLAVHVRRGDIVATGSAALGSSALDGRHAHKAIPLPLLDAVIRRARSDGQHVVVIGNGVAPLALQARYAGVSFASDVVHPGGSRPELDDFRDFCLLARSRAVISGGSAFAMVPTLIGGGRNLRVSDVLAVSDQVDSIESFLDDEGCGLPQETMLACAHVLQLRGPDIDEDARLRVIAKGSRADPSNPVLALTHAALLLRGGHRDQVERVLGAAMNRSAVDRLLSLMTSEAAEGGPPPIVALGGALLRDTDWELLAGATDLSPWIRLVIGLRMFASGDRTAGAALVDAATAGLEDPVAEAVRSVLDTGPQDGSAAADATS